MFCLFLISVGMTLSIRSSTTRKASGGTIGIGMAVLVGIPIALWTLAVMTRGAVFDGRHSIGQTILEITDPFFYMGYLRPGGYRYDEFPIGSLFGTVLLYGISSIVMLARLADRFHDLAYREA